MKSSATSPRRVLVVIGVLSVSVIGALIAGPGLRAPGAVAALAGLAVGGVLGLGLVLGVVDRLAARHPLDLLDGIVVSAQATAILGMIAGASAVRHLMEATF